MTQVSMELNGAPTLESVVEESIHFSYAGPSQPAHRRALIRAIELVSGQPALKRLYLLNKAAPRAGEDFYAAAVRLMRLRVEADPAALAAVPRSGPVLFVANHPYGVLDGVVLAALARSVRPGAKLLAHSLLCQASETADSLLPIDFSPTREARARTARSRLAAMDWIQSGEALAIFPGGSVATCPKPFAPRAAEFAWHPFVAKLLRASEASVVPVCFRGQNSRAFQVASHLDYSLRLSLLFRETARRLGSRVEVGVGRPIPAAELLAVGDREALMRELRRRTFAVGRALWPRTGEFDDDETTFEFPPHIQYD